MVGVGGGVAQEVQKDMSPRQQARQMPCRSSSESRLFFQVWQVPDMGVTRMRNRGQALQERSC